MIKKRTIFDIDSWARTPIAIGDNTNIHLQKIPKNNTTFVEKDSSNTKEENLDLHENSSKSRNLIRHPTIPEENVNMEIEETGNAAIRLIETRIADHFQKALGDIKITLNAPKGYILFPEPETNSIIEETKEE